MSTTIALAAAFFVYHGVAAALRTEVAGNAEMAQAECGPSFYRRAVAMAIAVVRRFTGWSRRFLRGFCHFDVHL